MNYYLDIKISRFNMHINYNLDRSIVLLDWLTFYIKIWVN